LTQQEFFMRKPILAGNWKMNKTPAEAVEFVRALRPLVTRYERVETVVCPPYVALPAVADALRGVKISVGAQNVHWAESGAYTGEIAPAMLVGLADYVIIGHSERRQYFAETDELVNKKIKAVLAHGLKPIVCVGENLAQNEAGETDAFVSEQVRAAFAGLTAEQARGGVIAYEPIWAIGTGRTASPEQAQQVHALIRHRVAERNATIAGRIRILYGGSMKPTNAADLVSREDIDGGLIGGASLAAEDFLAIAHAAARV